ncbi:MAG: diphthine synthase [Candidatus Aenigmarchaeota archaeon]|nr:diphthine synthase [Candidatus Aenigmarchaeota archaeon]
MLYLIGLGIWDERDISVKGLEICRKADDVYCELYTAAWGGSLKRLGKMIGKEIGMLERKDVENDSETFVEKARKKEIVLLVPGDPLVATTHLHLLAEAKEKGVPFEVVHSSSILTVVGRTGLHLYKFGRVVTIPSPEENYSPDSFYEAIAKNMKMGLHSLLLLDIELGTKKALEILKGIDKEKKGILKGRKMIICSKLGSDKEIIVYGKATDLPPPAVIIIPGDLHFSEEEFLEKL